MATAMKSSPRHRNFLEANKMCLSTAYQVVGGSEKLIADKITNLSVEGESVTLTTLLGTRTVVEGTLKSIDLNRNIILIEAKQ